MATSLIWTNQNGTLAINRNNLRDFYAQCLQNYLPSVCFQVEARCEVYQMMNCAMSYAIRPGSRPTLSEAAGETVLSYSYSNQDHDGAGINNNIGYFMIGTTYNMNIQFTNTNGSASIVIAQHLVISYDMKNFVTASSGNGVDKTIVDTYTLTVDESGILSASVNSETTDNSTPPVDSIRDFFTDSDAFIGDIQRQGDALVSTGGLNIPLSNKSAYSFPSGQTSPFKSVQFSENQDLVASVA
ncbi:hypothetical protein H9Q72_001427 [Fusarium xylarioides]|uniref:Uncharacterized protein n=1 Tax=Fusarium xylarioides TaxID=221167 RepID=A0A9P7I2Z0_9HYPO|nr:hypothetical protein H9Q72_001427 [Fusarium xylarioides]